MMLPMVEEAVEKAEIPLKLHRILFKQPEPLLTEQPLFARWLSWFFLSGGG